MSSGSTNPHSRLNSSRECAGAELSAVIAAPTQADNASPAAITRTPRQRRFITTTRHPPSTTTNSVSAAHGRVASAIACAWESGPISPSGTCGVAGGVPEPSSGMR